MIDIPDTIEEEPGSEDQSTTQAVTADTVHSDSGDSCHSRHAHHTERVEYHLDVLPTLKYVATALRS